MKKQLFNELVTSIKEAGEIYKDKKKPSRSFKYSPLDIKKIRKKLSVSQSEFALMIGVSKSTLQNWEQGRRKPVGPAKALLRVAALEPGAVLHALHS